MHSYFSTIAIILSIFTKSTISKGIWDYGHHCGEYRPKDARNGDLVCDANRNIKAWTENCNMECNEGWLIHVIDSEYCKDSERCYRDHGFLYHTDCTKPEKMKCVESQNKLVELCDHKNSCSFKVDKAKFGDPSPYCKKALHFNYDCRCDVNNDHCPAMSKCVTGDCICPDGWISSDGTPENCNKCKKGSNACGDHGTCGEDGNCVCKPEWKGIDCTTPRCTPGNGPDCNGHGICNDKTKCECNTGWKGDNCEKRRCEPHDGPECNNQGTCNEDTGVCTCHQGWTGWYCDQHTCGPYDGSDSLECYGNGQCNRQTGECECNGDKFTDNLCKCNALIEDQCPGEQRCDIFSGQCKCELDGWEGEQCKNCTPNGEGCGEGGQCDPKTKQCVCYRGYISFGNEPCQVQQTWSSDEIAEIKQDMGIE